MTSRFGRWSGLVAGCLCCVLSGCQPPAAETPTTRAAADAAPVEADALAGGETSAPDPNVDSAAEPTQVAAADTSTAEAPAPSTNRVSLPDDSLTGGIPGSGPLAVEQIKAWLADPANHAELAIELPLGLAEGAGAIKGIDANPLTRAKIELGRQLYFDTRLSSDNTVSCASCHHPDEGFGRHTRFGVGINGQEGGRNSPVSYNRILSDKQFWDGRAASLEEQAKGPIQNPIEMGNTHEKCLESLAKIEGYKLQFEKIFGGVTIDAVAQAIASFERVIVSGPTPYDLQRRVDSFANVDVEELKEDDAEAYDVYQEFKAAADANPMNESARRGMALFFAEKANCSACHVGANLTDELYHNLGVGMDQPTPDEGRSKISGDQKDYGAFKTPTIRNVALSAPYMHDGSQQTLEEVVEWYAKGGHPNPGLSQRIKKLDLTDQDKKDLVAFMQACSGPFPRVETGRLPE